MSDYQRRPSVAAPAAAPPSSLLEACVRAGLDRGGQRCPNCPVRDLCQSNMRWLVKAPLLQ
jgi:hypothetical protein